MRLGEPFRVGRFVAVPSPDLPPGVVFAFDPDKIARQLGLFPYLRGPAFPPPRRRSAPRPDMAQMLADIEANA